MAFVRPTLTELVDRIESDFVSRLPLQGAVLRRAVVRALARVVAGAAHLLHGHLDFLSRQIFPITSELEFLVRQGSLFGVTREAATYATGTATATGTGTPTVPAGTKLQRGDGAEFTVDADQTLSGGTATIAVTAVLAGAAGTLTSGVSLTFESPISGVDSTVTVTASTADGNDEESDDALRARVIAQMQEPAHGGNSNDYIAWSKEIPGVTRVWVYPLGNGPGTVVVRFARDNDVSPIPDGGEVTAVQNHLNDVAPAHATVTVVAPTDSPDAFTMAVVPNTVAVKNAVTAELQDLYLREAAPGATMLISSIRTAIGSAAGLTDFTLATPSGNVTHTANQLPSVGTVTFT